MYRPLSPHIFIYKAQLNTINSVLHRFTGIYLSLFLILLIIKLKFIFYHINIYLIYFICFYLNIYFIWLIFSFFFIFIISIIIHLFGGLRHLIWDLGYLLSNNKSIKLIYISIIFILFSLIIFWILF